MMVSERVQQKQAEDVGIRARLGDGLDQLDDSIVGADVLLTGFPGFVGRYLLDRLADLHREATFYVLIEARHRQLAERTLAGIEADHRHLEGRWELVDGDITDRFLGLGQSRWQTLADTVGVVWHLAAIYDLAVAEQIAYRVNVTGTIHVLDFCEACADLHRFNYVSTCYVSGERKGTIYEDELDEGQGHKNHYESTKFWAEVEVQRRSHEVPTAIFRPGIIVGDSKTGATDKYDGPYFLMKLLQRLPDWMPMVNVGKGQNAVNLVPIDFAADAMAYLGTKEIAELTDAHPTDADVANAEVFHIADANPMRARDIIALTLDCMDKAPALAAVPPALVDVALGQPGVEKWVGVPREALTYFNDEARYDSSHTQRALAGTGIHCPHLSTYMQTLVDYFLTHPDKGFLDRRRG